MTQDKIHIRDLRIKTIIGVHKTERIKPQELILNLSLSYEGKKAGETDKIRDTVDYQTVSERVVTITESSQYHLLETLASDIAQNLMKEFPISRLEIIIDKPGILPDCRSVAVEMAWSADDFKMA